MTIGDRQSLDQGSDHQALGECGDKRPAGEAGVPDPAQPLGLVAVFEGHAAQDQTREHNEKGQVKGREQCRIDDRKGPPEHHSGDDQPGLVAVPDRRHRTHHRAPALFIAGQPEKDADAEVEAVEQYVKQNAYGQYGHPEHDHGYSPAGT